MKPLSLYNTESIDELAWPSTYVTVTLDSPAISVFTDFRQYQPLVVDISTSAVEAEQLMRKSHVRLKIVVDEDRHFLGMIDVDRLNAQEIMRRVAGGMSRDAIPIAELMRPKSELMAFDFADLEHASVGDVVGAMKGSAQQHCLVIDRKAHQIRGVISAADLARRLHLPIEIVDGTSFIAIFKAVEHT